MEARFKGYVQPSSLSPQKGGGAELKVVIRVPRADEHSADVSSYLRMMGEGAEVEVIVRPSFLQASLFRQEPSAGTTDEPVDSGPAPDPPLPADYDPSEDRPDSESLAMQAAEGGGDDLSLRLVQDRWEGTDAPLYEAEHLSAETIADLAFDARLPMAVIRQVSRTERQGVPMTRTLLYLWDPNTRKLSRVPQHSVQQLVERLSA